MVAALGLMTIVTAVGVSIEIGNLSSAQSKLQSQVDMASLAAAATASMTNEDTDYAQVTHDSMLDNGYSSDNKKPEVVVNGQYLNVTATVDSPGLFSGLLGKKSFKVTAAAQTTLPTIGKMEIVLALDNTASMGYGGKIGALKIAAGKLVDAIEDSDSGTKIALIPFARYINIGDATGTWLDKPEEYDTERSYQQATHSCESYSYVPVTETRDGEEYTYDKEICNGRVTTYETQYKTIESRYKGCVGVNEDPNHLDPISSSNRVQGLLNIQPYEVTGLKIDTKTMCPLPVHPLDDNYTEMGRIINKMFPVDVTYIPSGLLWAERLLDRTVAFTQEDRETGIRQIVILMSDGKNTAEIRNEEESDYELTAPPYLLANIKETDPSVEATDVDTLLMCKRMKAKGIQIITINYKIDDENAKQVLRDCASSPFDTFDAESNSSLISTFERIGDSLSSEIRLSQ